MARLPRLTVPGYPHHVIQRGNNRQPIFLDPKDRDRILALLAENATKFRVAVHAYVLMGNHFHLLVTPETVDGLPRMMQAVGRSYVRYFNDRYGRTGTLWEGRYKSVLVEDCEQVTRQLQYALEVEGLDYSRLEVSSPGLDRPIRKDETVDFTAGTEGSIVVGGATLLSVQGDILSAAQGQRIGRFSTSATQITQELQRAWSQSITGKRN